VNLLRTFLERFSRNRVHKRHLPADFGSAPILTSPDASLQFWKPGIESDLFDFAREFVKPDSVVWDVGANVGIFTVAAARHAGASGKVIAVEADIWLAELLRKTAALQSQASAPIQIIPAAVFDKSSIASFHIAKRGRACNFLSDVAGSSQTGGVRETVSIVTITLDWLLEQTSAPDVIKIDVEGAGYNVLIGAERVLTEARPVVLVEVFKQSCDRVTDLLLRHDYTLFDWDSKPRERAHRACHNTLAIPVNK
jgi:FkbM family methyltransferase